MAKMKQKVPKVNNKTNLSTLSDPPPWANPLLKKIIIFTLNNLFKPDIIIHVLVSFLRLRFKKKKKKFVTRRSSLMRQFTTKSGKHGVSPQKIVHSFEMLIIPTI